MPKLPVGNTLDYNPDSIINASKKLASIALSRMKNPETTPDAAALGAMDANRQIQESIIRLEDLSVVFNSLVLRIQNQTGNWLRRQGLEQTSPVTGEFVSMGVDENIPRVPDRQAPKPPGPTVDQVRKALREMMDGWGDDSTVSSGSTGSSMSVGEFARRMADERTRYSERERQDERNSQARPSSVGTREIDLDDSDDVSTLDDGFPNTYKPMMREWLNTAPWDALMFKLIQVTHQINSILNNRIRLVIAMLNKEQIEILQNLYSDVDKAYEYLIFPFSRRQPRKKGKRSNREVQIEVEENILYENEYGDEILSAFNTERKNVLMNLTVILNSWRQNEPTQMQTERQAELMQDFDTTSASLSSLSKSLQEQRGEGGEIKGAGRGTQAKTGLRNFYGEVIIPDGQNIPTIWGAYRSCPTKRLL